MTVNTYKTNESNDYPLTLLYDGNCPVCLLEMRHMAERNGEGKLRFVDIAAAGFDATRWVGSSASVADMQAIIHAVRPDGSLVRGVEVIRLAYAAAGLHHVARPLGWRWLQPLLRVVYAAFARNRYAFSKLAMPLITRIAATRTVRRMQNCDRGLCDFPDRSESP